MHMSKNVVPVEAIADGYEARVVEWGGYTAVFESIAAGTDYRAYHERCDCPHLGYHSGGTHLSGSRRQ
jgi:hypothetical protein